MNDEKIYSEPASKLLKKMEDKLYRTRKDKPDKATFEQFQEDELANYITYDELVLIYQDYESYYDEFMESLKDIWTPDKTDKNKDDDFAYKLHEYVINHASDRRVLSKKDFKKLTRYWKEGRKEKTMDEWYDIYYRTLHEALPGLTVNFVSDDKDISYMVYRSPNKRKKLYKFGLPYTGDKSIDDDNAHLMDKYIDEQKEKEDYEPRSFPTRENRKYYLHKWGKPNTYMIDIMFSGKFAYLVAININTRYLYVSLLNKELPFNGNANQMKSVSNLSKRSSDNFIAALKRLKNQGMVPDILTGDGEGCFNSHLTQEYYNDPKNNIKFIPIERMFKGVYPDFMDKEQNTGTQPLHSSLGIIDRVIRTLRDMAYNIEIGIINPDKMNQLVELYNNAPHKTLSIYAGEEVSPIMVHNDPELEKFIVRRICQENYNVKQKFGYQLDIGSIVKVYNDTDKFQKRRSLIQPGNYMITDYYNGLYTVDKVEDNGDINYSMTQRLPRSRITLSNEKVRSKI